MSGDERFDGLFLSVAQQAGNIDSIFDAFFGFLLRKTDFFTGQEDVKKAEKIVLSSFHKYYAQADKKRKVEKAERERRDAEKKERDEKQKKRDLEEFEEKERQRKQNMKIEEVSEDTPLGIQKNEALDATKADAEKLKKDAEKAINEAGAEDDEDDKSPPPIGNGGSTDKHTWTQTLSSVEVIVPIRPGTKSKQVVCTITTTHMKVGLKGEPLILDGKLNSKVKSDDSTWMLVDNKAVHINLEKFEDMKWWSNVLEGEPEINTKKICPENSKLSDLDGDTRMTVEKMMYDQRQKQMGKPTSDQEKQHEMLEKFKAQHPEMDFSKCNVNYGGGDGAFNFPQMN